MANEIKEYKLKTPIKAARVHLGSVESIIAWLNSLGSEHYYFVDQFSLDKYMVRRTCDHDFCANAGDWIIVCPNGAVEPFKGDFTKYFEEN